jgi:hypothetical protein
MKTIIIQSVLNFVVDALLDSVAYLVSKNKEMLLQKVTEALDAIIALGD